MEKYATQKAPLLLRSFYRVFAFLDIRILCVIGLCLNNHLITRLFLYTTKNGKVHNNTIVTYNFHAVVKFDIDISLKNSPSKESIVFSYFVLDSFNEVN